MGFLNRLFGGGSKAEAAPPQEAPPCGHLTLVPRWDNAQDMGDADKVTNYVCEACHQQFTPAEAQHMRETSGV